MTHQLYYLKDWLGHVTWTIAPHVTEWRFISAGPYVKVSLMLAGRQIKKTKTSVQTKTLNPVYNEAFVFDIPLHRLSDVSLLIRVLNSPGKGEEESGRAIGKATVGPDARTSIGLHHWNCMMTTPRKPIAQWHPLLDWVTGDWGEWRHTSGSKIIWHQFFFTFWSHQHELPFWKT